MFIGTGRFRLSPFCFAKFPPVFFCLDQTGAALTTIRQVVKPTIDSQQSNQQPFAVIQAPLIGEITLQQDERLDGECPGTIFMNGSM
jgi:hypothetical protein